MPRTNLDTNPDAKPWISAREVGRRLQIPHQRVKRVAEAADFRRCVIPGRFVLYHADDVEAIRAASVVGGSSRPSKPKVRQKVTSR